MSATLVFRKDLEDVLRSRMLWGIVVLFGALIVIVGAGASAGDIGDAPEEVIALFVNLGAALVIPIAAIFVGYLSITGERESGSLRVLFGLGHGRSDVVIGKLCSRVATILVVTAVVCLLAAGMTLGLYGELPLGTFAWFVVLTTLLAVCLTAFAVAVSAVSSTRYRAMAGAIGGYLVAIMFWYPAVAGLHYLVEGARPGYEAPAWYFLAQSLNPLEAYRQAVMSVTGRNAHLLIGWEMIVEDVGDAMADPGALASTTRVAGDPPVYLGEWAALVILAVWIVVPLVIGYVAFQRADLT